MIDRVDSGIGEMTRSGSAAIAQRAGISAGLGGTAFARAAEGVDRAVDGVDVVDPPSRGWMCA